MKGIDLEKVRDVITAAFDKNEFDQLLQFKFDLVRKNYVDDGPFNDVVFGVLQKAARDGWEPFLIAELAAARPLRPDVMEIYRKHAAVLVDETRRANVDQGVLRAYERFGLAPYTLQTAGQGAEALEPPSGPKDKGGLEGLVTPLLQFIRA